MHSQNKKRQERNPVGEFSLFVASTFQRIATPQPQRHRGSNKIPRVGHMTSILANLVSPDKDDEDEDHLHLRQHVPLTRVLSREKEACEFYNERKAMAEGHLSALVKSSSMSSPTARTSTTPASTSVEQKAALVTPTKNRPITPHRGKQSQKKSALSFKRGRKKEKKTTEPLKKDIFGKVTVSTPRLSPDSKRKHRVFWTQLDLNDVDDEDEEDTAGKNNVSRANATDLPDDEVTDQRAMKPRSTIALSTEVQENNDEPYGAFDGMLNAINTCLDCGWLGSAIEAGNTNNTHLNTIQPANFQNRALIMDSEDNGSLDTNRNQSYGRDFRGSNGFENTAIEVEFTDEDDAPDDEEEDDEEQKDRSPFIQLNPNGNVTAFTPKPSSDAGAKEGQAFSYDLTRSHTWGEKEKNAYLQAMAKKAKDDFKRRKGLVEDESVADDNADIGDRNSHHNKTPLKSALSQSKSADGISPAKSVGFSPAAITEFPVRKDLHDEYDGVEPPVVNRLGKTEGEFSDTNQAIGLKPSGSILSVGRRKKKGNFQQLGDDEEDEEMQNENFVSLKTDPKPRSLPHGDVFEFEDRNDTKPPLSSLKLDPYHDSSDVSVLGSVMVGGDGASVVSGKSHYTTGTNATNWSTSTRRRHRGAAKNRKVDLSDTQRPAGWLESIKAAAASNNRKWDPKHGWVDYIDEEELEIQMIGKLKPPLNNRKNKSTDDSDGTADRRDAVTIPFPSEWERDRDEMVSLASQDTDLKEDTADDYQNNIGTLRSVVQDAIPEGSDEESDDTEDRSSRKENSPIQRLKKTVSEKPAVSSYLSQDSHNDVFTNESEELHSSDSQNLAQPSVFDWIGRCQSSDIVKDAAAGGGDMIKEAMPKFRGVIGQAFSSKENEPNMVPINENKQELNDDDDFEGHRSFDFDTSGEETHLSNGDGFKVIESSLNTNIDTKERASTPSLEKGQEYLNRLKSLKRPTENEGDRSVTSVTSSVAAKATDWRKKVELKNQNDPTKHPSAQRTSTLFVSSADDSSTFEVVKKKELNDDDSIFKFEKGVAPKMYVRKDAEKAAPSFVLPTTKSKISEVNDSMSEVTTSTAPSFVPRPKKESFLSRLQACTGPVFDDSNEMPQAHLDFLKNSASCGSSPLGKDRKRPSFSNVPFCGNPENVHEDSPTKVAESQMKSSVAASYLQAIREKSRGTSFIPKGSEVKKTQSDISLGSQKSETWNRFLEKRNQALASSTKRSGSVASEDATSFAQKKVQEILNKVSKDSSQDNLAKYPRSSSAIPLRPPSSGGIPRSLSTGRQRAFESGALLNRSDAARAAEDLAAAKVEAMILSRKYSNDDGEI